MTRPWEKYMIRCLIAGRRFFLTHRSMVALLLTLREIPVSDLRLLPGFHRPPTFKSGGQSQALQFPAAQLLAALTLTLKSRSHRLRPLPVLQQCSRLTALFDPRRVLAMYQQCCYRPARFLLET